MDEFGLVPTLLLRCETETQVLLLTRLHDHNDYHHADLILTMMMGVTAILSLGLFFTAIFASEENFTISFVACQIIFGVLDILLAMVLLRDKERLPGAIRTFAIATLASGICQLSVVFSLRSDLHLPTIHTDPGSPLPPQTGPDRDRVYWLRSAASTTGLQRTGSNAEKCNVIRAMAAEVCIGTPARSCRYAAPRIMPKQGARRFAAPDLRARP